MKKLTLSFMAIAFTAISCYAQFTAKDVFTKDEIVYCGLDFTKAKIIADDRIKAADVKTKWIPLWNNFIATKQNIFDWKKAMDKASIYYDPKAVDASNAAITTEDMKSLNANVVKKEDAESLIASYKEGEKKEGIGMVLVVESFDKPQNSGNFWMVFFDIKTKKVLFSEHCSGKAHGGGVRDYWTGSVKDLIKEMDRSLWSEWKKKYK
jgi:hypothetical protein